MTDPATAPVSASTPPAPGEYLLRRRTVGANLTREAVARQLAALPLAPWPITAAAIAALEQRIERAERDIEPFSRAQAEIYRAIVPLDPEVYLKLALRLADDIRDVYAEAKAVGYDPKIMRAVIRLRKMKPDDRSEQESVLETYKAALGMA